MTQTRSFNPFLLRTGFIRPSRRAPLVALRAWFLSRFLRVVLCFGFVVVLIGPCRSGKTYLLERTTPGNIIDGAAMSRAAGHKPVLFDSVELPDAAFSIDEAQAFEPAALAKAIATLTDRAFAITIQHHRDMPAIADAIGARRTLLVELKSHH